MKIHGAEGMSPENIRDEINRGGRLVIYTYCVSILVMTFKKPTEVRLIKAGGNAVAAGWPYLLISLLFGWWGFPWGPIYTVECLYRGLGGGVDVTDDVLRAILPEGVAGKTAASPPPVLTAPPARAKGFNLKAASYLVGSLAALIILGISIYCFQKRENMTVVLASGLDRPYSVVLNGEAHTLQPYATKILEMPEGTFELQDAPGGAVVGSAQTYNFSLPFFDHLSTENMVVINPDRVAVLIDAEVPYYSDGTTPPQDEAPAYMLLVNRHAYFIPKPDFVLERATERISMPSGVSRLVKHQLEHMRAPDLNAILGAMQDKIGYPAVREHLTLLAKYRTDEDFLTESARFLKPEDMRAFYQLHLADRPVAVEWHRYYQQQMENNFPDHDLVGEYRAYLQKEPDNGALIYLLGRQVRDPAEQARLWQRALAATPPCQYAHGAMAFDAMSAGRFAEALDHLEAAFKAGLSTSALRHYHRQVLVALDRPQEALEALKTELKEQPLDLMLADEQIRTTYLATRDKAAALKMKESYLTAYGATKPGPKSLADAEAFLGAGMAYLWGEMPEYVQLISRFEYPYYQFRAAYAAGKLKEAEQSLTTGTQGEAGVDATGRLLLFLLAHRTGDAAAAARHFQLAREAMKKEDQTFRQIATMLDADKPDAQAICGIPLDINRKRILLTAFGVQMPGDRDAYFALARKLNFNGEFPHRILYSFLME